MTQFAQILTDHCASGGIVVISTHLDLSLRNAQTLDVTEFTPSAATQSDPFLEGSF